MLKWANRGRGQQCFEMTVAFQASPCPASKWTQHKNNMHIHSLYYMARCGSRSLSQGAIASLAVQAPHAEETVRRYLDRIAETDAAIRSFITVDTDGALKQVMSYHPFSKTVWNLQGFRCSTAPTDAIPPLQAQEIDAKIQRGEDVGPLAGVPIAVKVVAQFFVPCGMI